MSRVDQPLSHPIIPPEALKDPLHPYWQPTDHPPIRLDESDDSWEEFPAADASCQRVDEPSPLQLETRGITSYRPDLAHRAKQPESQSEFWSHQTIHKNTVAAKLREAGMWEEAQKLENCHSTWTIAHCNSCGLEQKFPNRCDNFYCPECQPRLSRDRFRSLEWWTSEVQQPKHVVLTVANIPDLCQGHILELKRWWTRLRARKFCDNWRGGLYGIEVTNEGKGWHLHIHALVDARWIDAPQLAREWCSVTGAAGYIVKVKDVRNADYLREVCKYAVKGNQLATWTPDQIATFVRAFDGVRTFGVFGNLYGKRTEFAEWIKAIRESKPRCSCGSSDVTYSSEIDHIMHDLRPNSESSTRPPPPQIDLAIDLSSQSNLDAIRR